MVYRSIFQRCKGYKVMNNVLCHGLKVDFGEVWNTHCDIQTW